MQQQLRHPRQRARVAQGVTVRLRAGEGGDCAGDVDSRLCVPRREHRHEWLDRDPQHVAVPRVCGEGGDHADHRHARVRVGGAAARPVRPHRVRGGEGAGHVGESAEAVERLARCLFLRQRRDRLCGVLLRALLRRVEKSDDGRDRVEIGEQRAPLVHVLEQRRQRQGHVLLHRLASDGEHVQHRLEASRVEDEPPAPSHDVRQREGDVLLHLHGTA
mmetsp:Transcript_39261/g.127018  ORF Transcript_39261/g.127018 Transcript_39261/m.127018 type:complete len:217 (-) Transcript_39261:2674-3324(-)